MFNFYAYKKLEKNKSEFEENRKKENEKKIKKSSK